MYIVRNKKSLEEEKNMNKTTKESFIEKYAKADGTVVRIFYSKRNNEYTVSVAAQVDRTFKRYSTAVKRIKELGAIVEA